MMIGYECELCGSMGSFKVSDRACGLGGGDRRAVISWPQLLPCASYVEWEGISKAAGHHGNSQYMAKL